jgi:chromosome partitioning protein
MIKKIIVFGNEKGGTGKSTLAMHLTVSLLDRGYRVGTIDVDARQGTFSRYIENRTHSQNMDPSIKIPDHRSIFSSSCWNIEEAEKENKKKFTNALESLGDSEYVVIDTPGHNNSLSRFAHSHADVLITPMNESFVDLDLLVRVKNSLNSFDLRPSTYAEMVWAQKKNKAMRNKGTIDWIVLINRMAHMASKNRQELERVLEALAKRIGFRYAKGFKERVIFRELFASGLTLTDRNIQGVQTSLSHIAARCELADLLKVLNISSSS